MNVGLTIGPIVGYVVCACNTIVLGK